MRKRTSDALPPRTRFPSAGPTTRCCAALANPISSTSCTRAAPRWAGRSAAPSRRRESDASPLIAIVNYGVGNVRAIGNIYSRLGIPAAIVSTPDELRKATRIILPGVGAFDWTMMHLNRSGLRDALTSKAMDDGCPVLGICVGMQMLARRSDEGSMPGLGWIDGEVKRFDVSTFVQRTHLPHMGWNNVRAADGEGLFRGLDHESRFYFLHSYYFATADPADVL